MNFAPAQVSGRQDYVSRQAPRRRRRSFRRAARPPSCQRIGCAGRLPRPAVRRGSLWGRPGAGAVRAAGPGAGGGRAWSVPVGGWVSGPLAWWGVWCVSTGVRGSRGLRELCGGGGGDGGWLRLRFWLWRRGRPREGSGAGPARPGGAAAGTLPWGGHTCCFALWASLIAAVIPELCCAVKYKLC